MLEAATVSRGDVPFDEIYALGEVAEYALTPAGKAAEYTGAAEAVLCNKTPFDEETLSACQNLRYIGVCATGYNNIDIAAARRRGITVTNVPDYSTEAVAQHVFALILHFSNQAARYNDFVRDGGWIRTGRFSEFIYPIGLLSGKTLGIIGYGNIGRSVAAIARAFGMKILVNTRSPKPDGTDRFSGLEQLLSESDFISLHCPLTPETEGLINAERLRLCKKSAVIINTARGLIINEADLASALNEGVVAGAALDVVSAEPMLSDNPLLYARNCVITPHVAWAPLETRIGLIKSVAGNLKAFIDGNPINAVT